MARPRRFTCFDLERASLHSTLDCCPSCVEDVEMGYDICNTYFPGTGDWLEHCCRFSTEDLDDAALIDLHHALVAATQE